jgi:hypothetical protein
MNDYSTMNRPELLALCKQRGLSGAGTTEDLIDRLQAQDAAAEPADQDEDPLADEPDDEAGDAPTSESVPETESAETAPAESPVSAPAAESVAEASTKPDGPTGPDPRVKEGPTGNVFRWQFYLDRDIDDQYHRHLIAETHHAAALAGHRTKGAPHAGHRVGYSQDAAGKRTAVYEVYLSRGTAGGRR